MTKDYINIPIYLPSFCTYSHHLLNLMKVKCYYSLYLFYCKGRNYTGSCGKKDYYRITSEENCIKWYYNGETTISGLNKMKMSF